MEQRKADPDKLAELRKQAERRLREQSANVSELSSEDMQRMVHDLQVHQLELEMQNEELRLTQQNLQEARDKYSDLYDFAPVGYVTVSEKGLIVEANLTCASLLGVERSSLMRKPLSHFISRDDEDIFYLHRRKVLAEETRQTCELEMVRRDGAQFHAQLESIVIKDADGESSQYRTVISDVTERKRMEEDVRKAQKLQSVGTLAGGIAHDFNNVLTAILGNVSLAKMYKEPDRVLEKLTDAEKACIRAKSLTHRLLTFSAGGALVKEAVSITGLLRDSLSLALSGSSVRCAFDIPDDLWSARIDPDQMGQVFSNILINAREAMPNGGAVEVHTENVEIVADAALPLESGNYVKIAIKDRGPGIPEKHLQSIFDPYFTTRERGSGLGLAICYSIITNHNGHISVESQVGFGTTFYIYLPASPGETPVMQAEKEAESVAGTGRILVMDDEYSVRGVVHDILGDLGYEVTTVTDGGEAVEIYRKARQSEHPFDAVILDLTVPGGMGGREAVQKLLDVDPEVKAIVSSGYSNDSIMSDFRTHGFRGVLAKPYNATELSTVLHRVMAS